jgi:hypothetical protein
VSGLILAAGGVSTVLPTLTVNLGAGPVAQWLSAVLGVARSALPMMAVLALTAEAFGKPPHEPRDYAGVVWRIVIVVTLLALYPQIFAQVMGLMSSIAARFAPTDVWTKLRDALATFSANRQTVQLAEIAEASKSSNVVQAGLGLIGLKVDDMGTMLLDVIVTLAFMIGQVALWMMVTFGTVLSMLLYVVGPLAIVASTPRGVDVGSKWFRTLMSVLSWPLLASIIVGLVTDFSITSLKVTNTYEAAYNSLGVAGLLSLCAMAVPMVASSIVGGSLGAIGAGFASVGAGVGMAARAARSVTSAPGAVQRVADALQGGSAAAGGAAAGLKHLGNQAVMAAVSGIPGMPGTASVGQSLAAIPPGVVVGHDPSAASPVAALAGGSQGISSGPPPLAGGQPAPQQQGQQGFGWGSNQAFQNWRQAHPGADWASPEAREQIRAEDAKLAAAGPPAGSPVSPLGSPPPAAPAGASPGAQGLAAPAAVAGASPAPVAAPQPQSAPVRRAAVRAPGAQSAPGVSDGARGAVSGDGASPQPAVSPGAAQPAHPAASLKERDLAAARSPSPQLSKPKGKS